MTCVGESVDSAATGTAYSTATSTSGNCKIIKDAFNGYTIGNRCSKVTGAVCKYANLVSVDNCASAGIGVCTVDD